MTATRPEESTAPSGVAPRLQVRARDIRRLVLEESKRANVGHIGSALSVTEILAALYGQVLRPEPADRNDRDRFVLSKGHAALALYAALHLSGRITREQLSTYCADGSLLGVHPDRELPGVDFTTGSLGHGLSFGVGAAKAGRLLASDRRVFVLMSDAECNEGSVWEAAMFAAHHQLSNLVAIIDLNGQQALGYTDEVLDLEPLSRRWSAFGWEVHEVQGHDVAELSGLLTSLSFDSGPPHLVVARTVFGMGVSFMESQIRWHYLPLSDAEFAQAMSEVDQA
jgi:transketolase